MSYLCKNEISLCCLLRADDSFEILQNVKDESRSHCPQFFNGYILNCLITVAKSNM